MLKGFGVGLLLKPWKHADLIRQLESLTSGSQMPEPYGGTPA